MNSLQVVQRYIELWNAQDADGVASACAEDGTNNNSRAGRGLKASNCGLP